MSYSIPKSSNNFLIVSKDDFRDWKTINDTIMGGKSQATCKVTSDGLLLKGEIVEEGGGFISSRSPLFTPSLNLSSFQGIKLEIDGGGRTLKFGISFNATFGMSRLVSGALKWVMTFPTNDKGFSSVNIPFNSLEPTVRAKRVFFPVRFDSLCINQFQILYSKFGQPGELNSEFKPGPISIAIRSINAYI